MTPGTHWTRQQLLAAFELYCCRLNFGSFHYRNSEIVRFAQAIGRTPSALAMKLSNLASLDPRITSTGRVGLRGASASDRAMWEEMNGDWERFSIELRANLEYLGLDKANEEDFQGNLSEWEGHGFDRPIDSTARVGQSFFRATILSAYSQRCCITSLAVPRLLVASHIVPWRVDLHNRVNPRNGLLLSALHDKAFDAGFITVNENYTVRVSEAYREDAFFSTAVSAYQGKPISLPEKFAPDPGFLAYHREQVFIG